MTTVLALSYQGGDVPTDTDTSQSVASAAPVAQVKQRSDAISVDQLTAANAATALAEVTNLPAAGDLREATTTLAIKKELAQTDTEVISKPQIIQPESSDTRGIKTYVTKPGDTMATIAAQFKISAQTLRWANNTTSDAIEPGKTLTVPMVDGVVYTVKDGDTVQGLAEKYKANAERVVLYNDLQADAVLAAGTKLVLPGGELPETERPGYQAPRRSYGGGYARSSAYVFASVGNRYASGNCTWYSYERRLALGRPIGSFWGNANSWAASARAAGFTVNRTPAPGAIFQTAAGGGGYGHVGIVDRVENGRVFVSDMNWAGLGVVTHRELTNPGAYNYIH